MKQLLQVTPTGTCTQVDAVVQTNTSTGACRQSSQDQRPRMHGPWGCCCFMHGLAIYGQSRRCRGATGEQAAGFYRKKCHNFGRSVWAGRSPVSCGPQAQHASWPAGQQNGAVCWQQAEASMTKQACKQAFSLAHNSRRNTNR